VATVNIFNATMLPRMRACEHTLNKETVTSTFTNSYNLQIHSVIYKKSFVCMNYMTKFQLNRLHILQVHILWLVV